MGVFSLLWKKKTHMYFNIPGVQKILTKIKYELKENLFENNKGNKFFREKFKEILNFNSENKAKKNKFLKSLMISYDNTIRKFVENFTRRDFVEIFVEDCNIFDFDFLLDIFTNQRKNFEEIFSFAENAEEENIEILLLKIISDIEAIEKIFDFMNNLGNFLNENSRDI